MTTRYVAVRIVSWHIAETMAYSGLSNYWTLCGRDVPPRAKTLPELPGDERTCERCAVLAAKRAA